MKKPKSHVSSNFVIITLCHVFLIVRISRCSVHLNRWIGSGANVQGSKVCPSVLQVERNDDSVWDALLDKETDIAAFYKKNPSIPRAATL